MLFRMAYYIRTTASGALGSALREVREAAGQSLRGVASQLGRDPSVLSRWEKGERLPSVTDVAQMLTLLEVSGDRYDEIVGMAQGADQPRWRAVSLPPQPQQLNALLEFERHARTIIEAAPLLIPGLLQTTSYIRAIMTAGGVPDGDVETRVAVRIGRREVITRRHPAQVVALVGEAALRQRIGSDEVMLNQLRYLLTVSEWPNVDLRAVPLSSGWHPALEGPFTLIEPPDGEAPVVQLENRKSAFFLGDQDDVDAYRRAAEWVRDTAMSPERTSEFVADIANGLG